MNKPKRIPKQKPKIEVKKTYAPKDPKAYAKQHRQFKKEIKLLIKDIDSVLNEHKENTEFKLVGLDAVKDMIKHVVQVHLCYQLNDDEFEEIFAFNLLNDDAKNEVV